MTDDTTPPTVDAITAAAAQASWAKYYDRRGPCRQAFIAGYLSAAPLIVAAERKRIRDGLGKLPVHRMSLDDLQDAVADLLDGDTL